MAAAYSLDLRQRVMEAYTNGEGSMRQLGRRFKVSLYQRLLSPVAVGLILSLCSDIKSLVRY
jgi:hypothetical protein